MTTTIETVEIPLSKSKIVVMLLASLVFVALGCWFIINPPIIENTYWGDPIKLQIVGYASVLFFGLCAGLMIRKLPGNKPGLLIDDKGFNDYSSAITAGPIFWSDIEKISVIKMRKQSLVMVYVKEPLSIIERQSSLIKRKIMQLNYNMYGTPVSITANGLKISFDQLFKLLTDCYEKSNRANKQEG